jgi:hypothetical protein
MMEGIRRMTLNGEDEDGSNKGDHCFFKSTTGCGRTLSGNYGDVEYNMVRLQPLSEL